MQTSVLAFLLALPGLVEAAGLPSVLDSAGKPIAEPPSYCRVSGLDCVPIASVAELSDADTVVVETAHYGPRLLRKAGLAAPEGLALAKKATLVLTGEAPGYRARVFLQSDDAMDRPAWSATVTPGTPSLVPSGPIVLVAVPTEPPTPTALVTLLQIDEGGKQSVPVLIKRSLCPVLMRTVDEKDAPLPNVAITGGGQAGTTNKQGLFVFPVPTYLPFLPVLLRGAGRADASLSLPGCGKESFATRKIVLPRALNAIVAVDVEGAPAEMASVFLYEYGPNGGRAREPVALGATNAAGVWTSPPLNEGRYLLRCRAAGMSVWHEQSLQLPVETQPVAISLRPLVVRGRVTRGGDPLPDVTVTTVRIFSGSVPDDEVVSLFRTNEDGAYEGTVWTPGEYAFRLGTGVLFSRLPRRNVADGTTTVDIDLPRAEIKGTVRDAQGKGIGGARITYSVKGSYMSQTAKDDGEFQVGLDDWGTVRIQARARGFRNAEPVEVAVTEANPSVEKNIVLVAEGRVKGRVETALGRLAPDVRVVSVDPATSRALDGVKTDASGEFEIAGSKGDAVILHAAGLDCPLHWTSVSQDEPVVLRCPSGAGSLDVLVESAGRTPVRGLSVSLSQNGRPVPSPLLAEFLSLFQLPAATDLAGRAHLPGLAPGTYAVYSASESSTDTILMGHATGRLGEASVSAGSAAEIRAVR